MNDPDVRAAIVVELTLAGNLDEARRVSAMTTEELSKLVEDATGQPAATFQ